MAQRLLNMHLSYITEPLSAALRTLFATLVLLVFPMGVWGQGTTVTINQLTDFGVGAIISESTSLGNYQARVLQNNYTYNFAANIESTYTLYIPSGSTVTINLNNYAFQRYDVYANSYGLAILNDGTLIITNGTISGAFYTGNGGGIYNSGTITLDGVTITGNKCNGEGAGIYNNDNATLNIKGNTTVTGNTNGNGTLAKNIYLPEGKVINIEDNITGAANGIGVTKATRDIITAGLSEHGNINQFSADVTGLEIIEGDGGEAKIRTEWEGLQILLTEAGASSGTVTLNKDYISFSDNAPLAINGNVTLDLNGHSIDRRWNSSAVNGNVISIPSGSSLTITDTGNSLGTITGGNVSQSGGAIINEGTLFIQGGHFSGNRATVNGGAIFNTGTTTITGGYFGGNSAAQGGAIYNNGTLNISAGNISSNTASTDGGGIYHYDGTLNISGNPTISENHKSTNANNIYLASGKKITVNGNLSNTTPIGVTLADGVGEFTTGLNSHTGDYNKFASDDARFETANATNNEAKLWTFWAKLNAMLDAGGTINLDRTYTPIAGYDNTYLSVNSNITLNLNTYTINRSLATAIDDGFVIKVESGYTLTITGTGTIRGGNNTGNGGGIYIDGGTLVLSGGSITYNSAAAGGGIYNSGTLQMRDAPVVKNNTGSNIYLPDGYTTITLTGTLNGSDGNIGITMQTPGAFTSGLNTYGTIAKFFSDNDAYTVTLNGYEATLMTHWDALKTAFAAGGDINLTRNYTAPDGEKLEVTDGKTVTLDLRGYTIDRGLSGASAVANGYVIKVNTGSTLTIKDTGSNGKIKGGNNTGNGGGILNEGTLNIQGGTITSNSAANGGAIYNSGTLTVSGGTIQGNNATTNGGAIYHNGTSFSLQGSPTITNNTESAANNVYLATTKQITISGELTYPSNNAIGIACEDGQDVHFVFTSGLSGNGNASKFTSNQTGKGIGLNSAGEAIFGTSYTITREESNNSYTYMYIKGDYTATEIAAVEGEYVTVTISGDGNYHTVPVSLYYTDGVLSTYPKNGVEYGFDMPAKDVTVTGLCLYGGYCGDANNEDVKFYLDGTVLKFVGKDGSDYQMKSSYTSVSDVPWYNISAIRDAYTSVEIAPNVTSISPYAFFGSHLETIDIPSTVTSIGTFAFGNCQNLTTLTVNGGTSFAADGNVLYNYGKTNLICYPAGKTTPTPYTLPASVTDVSEGAFAYNSHLTAIEVAEGSPFTATDGVLYKDNELYCYPAAKADIARYPIAADVTAIKPYAFHNNTSLEAVYVLRGSVPSGGTGMFDNTTCKIMVKSGLKSSYQSTDPWSVNNVKNRIYEITLAGAAVDMTPDLNQYDYNYNYSTSSGGPVEPAVTEVRSGAGDGLTLQLDTDYTISYSNNNAIGTGTVTITGTGNYDGTNITKDFDITRKIELGAGDYWATFYDDLENLECPSISYTWIEIYLITNINWTANPVTIEVSQIGYIPKGKPVLIYSVNGHMANKVFHLKKVTSTDLPAVSEDFKGITTTTAYSTLNPADKPLYILRNGQFIRTYDTDGELQAHRCYIKYPDSMPYPSPAPAYLDFMNGDGGTTLITNPVEKMSDTDAGNWYTLDGRKLNGMPTKKGIYINNGRKVIIK